MRSYGYSANDSSRSRGADAYSFLRAGSSDSAPASTTVVAQQQQSQEIAPARISGQRAVITSNRIIVTLSSDERDHEAFPSAGNCELKLPERLEGVSTVRILAAEIPHTEFNLMSPTLFFSEYQDPVWVPFKITLSSANYQVTDFMEALQESFATAVPLYDSYRIPNNTYTVSFSETFGQIYISSNAISDFTLQFRSAPVSVVKAVRDPDPADTGLLLVTIADRQPAPLAGGACVTFVRGDKLPPVDFIVQKVEGKQLYLREIPLVSRVNLVSPDQQDTDVSYAPGDTGKYAKLIYDADTNSVYDQLSGTQQVPLTTASRLVPFSGKDGSENMGAVLGYGTLRDYDFDVNATNSTSPIVGIQNPAISVDGSVIITTQGPHFCNPGDFFRADFDSGLTVGGRNVVETVLDETHLKYVPDNSASLAEIIALVIYPEDIDAAGNPESPIYWEHISQSTIPQITAQGMGFYTVELTLTPSVLFDPNTFVGQPAQFGLRGSDPNKYRELTYAQVEIVRIFTSGADQKMEVNVLYPNWILRTATGVLTRLGPAGSTVLEDKACGYKTVGRYDFSRKRRFMYLAVSLGGRPIGNMLLPAVPGKRIFAKLALSAGQDAISFLSKGDLDGLAQLSSAVPTVQNIQLTLFNSDGSVYDPLGVDYSVTLEFAVTAPLQ